MYSFAELCDPAKLYVVLTIISVLFLLIGRQFGASFTKVLFAAIWTFLLNWLCQKGYSSLSWFLVLIPFILMGFAIIVLMIAVTKKTHPPKPNTNPGPNPNPGPSPHPLPPIPPPHPPMSN